MRYMLIPIVLLILAISFAIPLRQTVNAQRDFDEAYEKFKQKYHSKSLKVDREKEPVLDLETMTSPPILIKKN